MQKESKDPFDMIQDEINKDIEMTYSKKIVEYANNPLNMGKMNDPTGSAWIKGLCGVTLACGSAVTELAKNKNIRETIINIINEKDKNQNYR